jgi:predicted nucleic acid-binding protein
MTLVDTSLLIDSLAGPRRSGPLLRRAVAEGERLVVSSLVLYEWLRGPRTAEELRDQELLFPAAAALPFDAEDSRLSAEIYGSLRRARGREIDIAIAATAIRHDIPLWTLNPRDFEDIPRLRLFRSLGLAG